MPIGLNVICILTALAVIYIGFAVFFRSHFCFGTTIDGIPAGGYGAAQVEKQIRAEIENYSLQLLGREGVSETIDGGSIDLAPVFQGEVEEMLKQQNSFAWIVTLFTKQELELERVVSYDEEKLNETLQGLSLAQEENQRAPSDAACSEYIEGTGYELVPADFGTTVDMDALAGAVTEAILTLDEEVDLEEAGCYVEPKVLDDDETLLSLIDEMNRYVGTTITYDFGEDREVLDGETIHTWLSDGGNGNVAVDEEAVLDFVKSLAREYNTAYTPKEFLTSYGKTITISGGFYGWRIDNAGEVEQILSDLAEGGEVEREPVWLQTANSHGEHDYGDSYVEINLTAQHLFLYKDGQLVTESDFVSGNVSKGHDTPTGAFGLTYKTQNAILRGEDYETPVNYWMPFNGDVGMHDATWRSSFGGNIYKTNGSHGCINLPLSVAKKIYETIDAGYAVLVYTLPGTESKAVQQQDAAAVVNAINAIGQVTLESETAITGARKLYDALSDSAKAYVTNYDVLTAAEAALAGLKGQTDPNTQTDANTQTDPNAQADANTQTDPNTQTDGSVQ